MVDPGCWFFFSRIWPPKSETSVMILTTNSHEFNQHQGRVKEYRWHVWANCLGPTALNSTRTLPHFWGKFRVPFCQDTLWNMFEKIGTLSGATIKRSTCAPGLNSHYFHKLINPIVGGYIYLLKGFLLTVGWVYPQHIFCQQLLQKKTPTIAHRGHILCSSAGISMASRSHQTASGKMFWWRHGGLLIISIYAWKKVCHKLMVYYFWWTIFGRIFWFTVLIIW